MHIFKYLFFVIVFCIVVSCKDDAKVETSKNTTVVNFKLEGKIMHNTSNIVYLLNNSFQKLDSTVIEKNSFTFSRSVKEAALFYLNNDQISYPFIIDSTNFIAVIDNYKSMIIGGDLNTVLNNYKENKKELQQLNTAYYSQFTSKDISLNTLLKSIDSIHTVDRQNTQKFIKKHQNNILSEIIFDETFMSSNEALQLQNELRNSTNKKLRTAIENRVVQMKLLEKEKSVLRRKKAPDFAAVNLNGVKTKLQDIIKGKKAVLIDFWASWCPPCREASPEIKALYTKYFAKGFDILSVSEDRSVAEWKNGILVDGIESWNHVYDDYNRISTLYGVTALPHMILIDENGKMVKSKISMSELKSELKNIFKK